jgi:peptidylprolyl isomerase
MKRLALLAALALAAPLAAQDSALSPSEIVAAAPAADWVAIPAEELLVMTLAPAADGSPREVVIQLMPAPFSQGWVENIRLLARNGWYDGTSVNRVQDNYVTQWGDPNYDNPEATGKPKPLPEGLRVMGESEYTFSVTDEMREKVAEAIAYESGMGKAGWTVDTPTEGHEPDWLQRSENRLGRDPYAPFNVAFRGWPLSLGNLDQGWPVHCYGMVGAGRNLSPDTGSGAELYTVIGHAPRHLDRNIALVGRVVSGMEHLSSLPRGSGVSGFYTEEEAEKRTPILSVRVASDLPAGPASGSEAAGQQGRPAFEYLSTESETFAAYAEAVANRRDPFFIVPAGGADICNIRIPVRPVTD